MLKTISSPLPKFLLLCLTLYLAPANSLAFIVKGKIEDTSKKPIPNAKITVFKAISVALKNPISDITEKNGLFLLNLENNTISPNKPFFLKIIKPGYQKKTIFIDPLQKIDLNNLIISLKKLVSLGTVQVRKTSPKNKSEREGISSTTINQEAIEKMKLERTEELSGLAPNLHSLSTGSAFTHFFAIRGISSVNTVDPLIGMYIDGVAQFQTYTFPVYINNLKNIQILKGPQGTFYGRNAMGGVIDIQTYSPPHRLSAKGNAEVGNYGRQSYSFDVSAPLFDPRFFIKTGGNYHQFNGFFKNITLNQNTGNETAYGGYLAFNLFFNSFFNLEIRTKYENLKEGAFPYSPNEKIAFKKPYSLTQNKENYNAKEVVDNYLKIDSEWAFLRLSSVTTYQLFNNGLGVDTDFSFQDIGEVDLTLSQHLITEELKLSSTDDSNEWFSWMLGSYSYFQNRKAETDLKIGKILIPNTTNIKTKEHIYGIALFGNITYPLYKSLFLILGMRGDYENKNIKIYKKITYKRSSTYPSGKKEIKPEIFLQKHNFNYAPKIGLNLYFSPTSLAYTSIARGYRSGGLNGFVSDLKKMQYDPENSWHAEIGIKGALKRFAITTSFFYIYWEKQQVNVFFDQDGLFEFGIQNSGKSQSWGGEWEIRTPLIWGLSSETILGFNEATFIDFKQNGENYKNNYQPFVPKQTLLVALEHQYQFKLFSLPFQHINRFDYKYISSIFYNIENTTHQPGYSTINLTSNMTYWGVTISLWVKNLLDKRYLSFALPFSALIPSKLGDPRNFGAKISFMF